MRQNGIPAVFHQEWPIETNLNFPDLEDSLKWSPWGVFNSQNIHCYTEDYRFEITWRTPELSLKRVLELDHVIAPDFTVYSKASPYINNWQLYRSLAVFSYWQNMGVNVIPSINWISASQIEFNLNLYPPFTIIAVRCPHRRYLAEWTTGAKKIAQVIKPSTVLHFGTALGMDVWTDAKVINFSLRPKIKNYAICDC